jgi:hypothetical protein
MTSDTLSRATTATMTRLLPGLLPQFASVTAVTSVCLSLYFLLTMPPFIQGVDFYYYTLISRDLAAGEIDVTPARYWYFPGFYSFWRMVISITPGDLESLQWAFCGVLFLNALLIGLIAWELIGVWQIAALAGSFYPFQAFLLEGFFGTAEPVVTLPFLIGLWAWARLVNRGYIISSLTALGVGLGLAVFVKQQGVLLVLGTLGLLPPIRFFKGSAVARIAPLIVIPISACTVFLCAMAIEGGGLSAIKTGLGFAKQYQADGLLADHLSRVAALTGPLTLLLAVSMALWMYCLAVTRETSLITPNALAALGICVVSALIGASQFGTRGYLHYALLSLPSAILAAAIGIGIMIRMLQTEVARRRTHYAAVVLAIGLLILIGNSTPQFIRLVSEALAALPKDPPLTTLAKNYQPICTHVPAGSALLLIPPRNNSVHWLCGTKPVAWKVKLDWIPPSREDYLPTLTSNSPPSVFMFSQAVGPYEERFLRAIDAEGLRLDMIRVGYREVLTIPAGVLFQKQ